jgi:putative transposase
MHGSVGGSQKRRCNAYALAAYPTPLPATSAVVGVDLGLTDVVTRSTGEKTSNQRFFQQDEKRLARLQRRHARKRKGSNNREKARRQVAKLHARIADRRRDFQHKLTTHVIRENQTICVESLAVKQMVQHPTLSKAIADVGWGEILRQLEYKAAWYGRTLVKIDRWYPSSKTCSACGWVVEELDLDERSWTCPQCVGHAMTGTSMPLKTSLPKGYANPPWGSRWLPGEAE